MEKRCIIIMPVSEPDGYPQGHFKRVYDYIVAPACRMAGFWPARADDPADKALDILKNIVDSDMAIFDLSSNNSSALYGMAIRQSLNLPLILIKDLKTQIIFNTQDFSEVGYDESLRIDTVQKEVETLRETLEKTYANKAEKNSLVSRLGIGPGQIIQPIYVPVETNVLPLDEPVEVHPVEPKEKPLPVISPIPDYVGNPIDEADIEILKVGDSLFHINHGRGEIKTIRKISKDRIAEIHFDSGSKTLVLGTSGFLRKVNS